MNTSTHTPGPWRAGMVGNELHIRAENGPNCSGVISVAQIVCHSPSITEEMKANARLIAAAPAMFQALKLLRDSRKWFEYAGTFAHEKDGKIYTAGEIISEAIAKATEGGAR